MPPLCGIDEGSCLKRSFCSSFASNQWAGIARNLRNVGCCKHLQPVAIIISLDRL